MQLGNVCNRLLRVWFYLLAIVTPLVLTPWNYELFEFNKMIVTYIITILILSTWLVKSIAEKKFVIRKTPLDIPIWLFVGSQLISSLFSMDPHVSWWGYYSRYNGGMWSVISYVSLYYVLVSMVDEKKQPRFFRNLFISVFSGAMLVSLYAILQRMGIDKHLWVQDVQNRVFSTLGQPNWLAAYLSVLIPIPFFAGLIPIKKATKTESSMAVRQFTVPIVSTFITLFLFSSLIFTRSRSGLLAAGLAIIAIVVYRFMTVTQKKLLLIPSLMLGLGIGLLILWNAPNIPVLDTWLTAEKWQQLLHQSVNKSITIETEKTPSSSGDTLLVTGGTESTTIRKYVWDAAIRAWQSTTKTIFIGTGTETFAFAFYQFKPKEHNLTSEWDFLYNKAHNEYLNYLATTGIFGLGTYLSVIGVFIFWYSKLLLSWIKDKQAPVAGQPIERTFPFFIGWLTILITNFFGFSVVVLQLLFILIPAGIISTITIENAKRITIHLSFGIWPKRLALGIIFAISLVCMHQIVIRWYADTLFASSYRESRSAPTNATLARFSEAINLVPDEPFFKDEYASTLATVAVASLEHADATNASKLASLAEDNSAKAIAISPNNVNYWKTRTRIFYALSTYDVRFTQEAIKSLEEARRLSPNDPKVLYNLAVLMGRIPDNAKAIQLLQDTITSKPNYRDAYYALYLFYLEEKKPSEAKNILEEYLKKVDGNDKQFKELLVAP